MSDGSQRQFECGGVGHIKCSPLLLQNVAYRVCVTPITALKGEEIRQLIAWSFTLDNAVAISPNNLGAYVDGVMTNKLTLLHVEPSWGAQLVVLCTSVVLRNA